MLVFFTENTILDCGTESKKQNGQLSLICYLDRNAEIPSLDISWQDVLHLCFISVKLLGPNQAVPCTWKVIKLVPMRVSSLIMPAPDILLTPLSHYQSPRNVPSHTLPPLNDRTTGGFLYRLLSSYA